MSTGMQILMERTNDLFSHYDLFFRKPVRDKDALSVMTGYAERLIEICGEYAYQYILANPAPTLEYTAVVMKEKFQDALEYVVKQSAFQRHMTVMMRLHPALEPFKQVLSVMEHTMALAKVLNVYHPD